MPTMTTDHLPPLVKTALLPCRPEQAFELFTGHMARWWPLATHSVGEAEARSVVLEPGPGGSLLETLADGRTTRWGTVTTWEPPHRVAFTWHPGRSADEATAVDVTFAVHEDATRVTLTHTGWNRRGDGVDARQDYDTGWEYVLRCLVAGAR